MKSKPDELLARIKGRYAEPSLNLPR
jgi:hypothetical protein